MTKAIMKQICILFAGLSALANVSQAVDQCQLAGYNLQPLTKVYWGVSLDSSACQNVSASCTLLFTLCHIDTMCPDGSFACLVQHGSTVSLGGEAKITEKTDGGGFDLQYEVKPPPNETSPIEPTTIEFVCDSDFKHKADPQYDIVKKLTPQSTARRGTGYILSIRSELGCKRREGLGPGSQLMIILLVLFLAYFCGGMVYNHVNGARGEELIPHHWFWKNLPSYVVDGCIFVVRLITCQTRENYSQNPDYGSTSPAGVSPSGRTYETL